MALKEMIRQKYLNYKTNINLPKDVTICADGQRIQQIYLNSVKHILRKSSIGCHIIVKVDLSAMDEQDNTTLGVLKIQITRIGEEMDQSLI